MINKYPTSLLYGSSVTLTDLACSLHSAWIIWPFAGMSNHSLVSKVLLLGSHLGSRALLTLLLHNCMCACSKWGHNRVAQHIGREQVLSLTLPVETDPDIVCQAVSGLLGSFVKLSASNVEALLVLANSVGVCPASPTKYNLFRSNHKVLTHTHLFVCCSLKPWKRHVSATCALEHTT